VFQGRTKRTYYTSSFTYNYHRSALDVQAAANQGCHFCTLILSLLSADEISRVLNYNPDLEDGSTLEDVHVQVTTDSSEDSLKVNFPLTLQGRTYESEEFCIKHVKLIPASGMLESLRGQMSSKSKSLIHI
jgi:hypothetical protein